MILTVDTNETFIVTRLNDKPLKPLNIVTTFVQSVHPSPAHKHKDGHATRQLHCLVGAVSNVHQMLLAHVSVVHL